MLLVIENINYFVLCFIKKGDNYGLDMDRFEQVDFNEQPTCELVALIRFVTVITLLG